MSKMIEIYCLNNQTKKNYPLGTSLSQIIEDQQIKLEYPILGATVNNLLEELSYEIFKPKTVRFIDITEPAGMRMYTRGLFFVLMKAVSDVVPKRLAKIEHAVSKGYYCEIDGYDKIDIEMVFEIGNRMREIIAADIPFIRKEMLTTEVIKIFDEQGYSEKVLLFKSRPLLYSSVYYLDDMPDYFFGPLIPSTSYIHLFDLQKYYDSMLLMVPDSKNPSELADMVRQDKMFDIICEYNEWGEILGVGSIGSINEAVQRGEAGEIIKVSEALHEKKVSQIADEISRRKEKLKLVLISGPSSSGKTTFCKRLAIQLKVAGLKPIQISLDNYFVDRDKTPTDEKGDYDFEALEAIDIKQFNQDLLDLMSGKEILVPKFSFEKGIRFYDGETMKMNHDNILLAEGIHALNPNLTPMIEAESKFKIYVSALTQVGIDWHNRIPTTDNRLIRRMIRDFKYRNYSALQTLKRWGSVRNGENKNIFPFQEEADVMFNSALVYELGVLKRYVEPLLREITPIAPEYDEAHRLLKFLSYFAPIPDDEIPPTSILREFLTGSTFDYT